MKVVFAVKPAPVGAADVPVIVTTRLLNGVVPFVPSNDASNINNAFTDAILKTADVVITFPVVLPICLSVVPSVKVVNPAQP